MSACHVCKALDARVRCVICGLHACNACAGWVRHDPNNSLVTLPVRDWYAVCETCEPTWCSYCFNLMPRYYHVEQDGCIRCKDCPYPSLDDPGEMVEGTISVPLRGEATADSSTL